VIVKRLSQIYEPIGFGNSVVVMEGYDLTGCHSNSYVARERQVADRIACDLDSTLLGSEYFGNTVLRRSSYHTNLERWSLKKREHVKQFAQRC
jgi:hypothetical protein